MNIFFNLIIITVLLLPSINCIVNWENVNIAEINKLLFNGNSCKVIIQDFVSRISQYNKNFPSINAIISINSKAIEEAKELDDFHSLSKILKGPLHCIPTLIKDNIDVHLKVF